MSCATMTSHSTTSNDLPTSACSISDLPIEILMEIFTLSSFGQQSLSLRAKAPLLLTEVCHKWRNIAFATSALWDDLDFIEPYSLRTLEHNSRIRSGMVAWYSHVNHDRPLSLSLLFRPNGFRQSHVACRIPWASIAHLHIRDFALCPLTLAKVLRECPRLITCNIEGVNCITHPSDSPETKLWIELPELVSLTLTVGMMWAVESDENTSLNVFPGLLWAPALQHITVHGQDEIHDDCLLAESLLESVVQSAAPLENLGLHSLSFNSQILFAYLREVPSLEYLSLSPKDGDYGEFAESCWMLEYDPDASQNILPNLKVLTIEDNVPDDPSEPSSDSDSDFPSPSIWDQTIVDMATTRRWSAESYPHAEAGLEQLEGLYIKWLNRSLPEEMMSLRGTPPRMSAIRLLRGGLEVEYPSLDISSIYARASLDVFGDDGYEVT